MLILGIESSCDETATTLLKTPNKILSQHIASQDDVHAKFGGVVPELASRRHMETLMPLVTKVLCDTKISLDKIDGIAVTRAPGLIGSILVGLSFAKALAYSLNKPIIGVNHLEGHLNAAFIEHADIPYPYIGLVVSGGHTSLYLVKDFGKYKLLGATRDDAAGEAFDKAAKILGLGYPGGPIIDKTARNGNPDAYKFTHPNISSGTNFDVAELDFSFSGIKTAVMLLCKRLGTQPYSKEVVSDVAASFQQTIVDIIIKQMNKACEMNNCRTVIVSGGVAANTCLRASLEKMCNKNMYQLFMPSLKLCTDNAAMIAYVGGKYLEMGKGDGMELSAMANEEIGI